MAKQRRNKKKQEDEEFKAAIILTLILTFFSLLTGTVFIPVFVLIFGITGAIALYIWRVYDKSKKTHEYQEKIRQSGIHEIDQMTGAEFEFFLKELFVKLAFKVEATKPSGDFGADLILRESFKSNDRIVVQAKRSKSPVSVTAVQEVASARTYYGATAAWVVTNNRFTKPAIELANRSNVKLIPREFLVNMMNAVNQEEAQQKVSSV